MMQVYVSENIRFLLWLNGTARATWAGRVREWTGCDPHRAEALLASAVPSPLEIDALAAALGKTDEELRFARLVEESKRIDVLQENLRHLIDGLPHGEQKQFAAALDVHPTTVSRWKSGVQRPSDVVLREIGRYFGVPDRTDLRKQPLFLEFTPRSDQARRDWLHEQVQGIPSQVLAELFPALERLLRSP